MKILKQTPTTAVVDGGLGLGLAIGPKCMQLAIDKAKKHGIGMVAVRNSTHYGFAGYYALMAEKEGCIGITGTNARPSIAPTYGVEPMMGTNPLVFGMPTDESFPFGGSTGPTHQQQRHHPPSTIHHPPSPLPRHTVTPPHRHAATRRVYFQFWTAPRASTSAVKSKSTRASRCRCRRAP